MLLAASAAEENAFPSNAVKPFVDRYGQFAHCDWPGKVHCDEEMTSSREAEEKWLKGRSCPIPDADKYGGWAGGPKLKATGFFRTEKVGGVWWLVDPDGRLFYSHGVDCVDVESVTGIGFREDCFSWIPSKDDEQFGKFRGESNWPGVRGFYGDRAHLPFATFDFAKANAKRKYGADWYRLCAVRAHDRIRAWGLNTIGNWSDPGIYGLRRTPYTVQISTSGTPRLKGSTGWWGALPDPFGPEFETTLRKRAKCLAKAMRNDPWCIGVFVDNELSWNDEPRMKDVAERYFSTVRRVLRDELPNHLYLGCRIGWGGDSVYEACARHCDVVSVNYYGRSPKGNLPPGAPDKPMLIGEFHFGALDRGLFRAGLVATRDQKERAESYLAFVNACLDQPRFVGVHWFQWRDQPLTGRPLDGENYQIGFVTVTDAPYPELVDAAREIGATMYRRRSAATGLAGYSIVRPSALPKTDLFVLDDMRGLLARGLGGERPPVCDPGEAPAAKRIFFGMPPPGFDVASLADQEHVVEVRDGDVYLFGGGTNGTRYAAYDFLQGVLGYRFFDMRGGMHVPDLKAQALTNCVRRHVPAFETRHLPCWRLYGGAEMAMFLFRHGMNGAVDGSFENLVARECGEGAAVADDFNAPYPGSHSLVFYVPRNSAAHSLDSIKKRAGGDLEALHPEWFSLQGGRRVFGHQRCLSNPDVRTFLKEGIYPRMASYKPRWLTYFDLSAGDTPGRFCECEGCSALEAKYGTTAGPLLDVALELCAGAAERYPRRNVKMLVYRKAQTQRPPKGIERLPDNFVPQFAPIDDDFSKDWTHQNNADTLADLKEWCSLSRRTLLWYYPNPYGGVTPPFGNVERFANDLRIAKEAGVTGLTVEHDMGVAEMTGFTELQTYILTTMWNDASKDCQSLVREFVDFEYGAASGEMAAYLAELERLRRESKTVFPWEASRSLAYYGYLTPERLMRWEAAFDRMEAMLAGDRTRLRNLRRVRYNLDSALLARHREVSRACGDAAPSVETLADRIEAIASEIAEDCYVEKYAGKAAEFKKSVANRVYLKRLMGGKGAAGLPEDIFGNVPQANICITLPISYDGGRRPDSAAAYGVAALFEGAKRPEVMKLPFIMSFTTTLPTSTFVPRIGHGVDAANIGPRGKYRFYDMGELTVTRDCYVRLGDTYWFQANISEAYVEGSFNRARVYASLKFQGPAFYPADAGGKNQVWCDRVVVVQE